MELSRRFTIGDTIPLEQADRSDTFFMVVINGEKYLVDRTGKILLTPVQQREREDPKRDPIIEKKPMAVPEYNRFVPGISPPKPERMNFRFRPGSSEFSQAVREASNFMNFFSGHLQKYYRQLAPLFESRLERTRIPYFRFFENDKDSLANLKAFLMHDFFSHTNIAERGMDALEFLTILIARETDGDFRNDSRLPRQSQKALIMHFADFIKTIGTKPGRERLFSKIYHEFTDELHSSIGHSEGIGHYIRTSIHRIFDHLRQSVENEQNRNFIQTSHYRIMNQPINLYLDNILAFLKVMLILRLNSLSRKEERGGSETEREELYYQIVSFNPDWYT